MKILLTLFFYTLFVVKISYSQKIESGFNLGFADASLQNTNSNLKNSVLGFNAGVYIEQNIFEDASTLMEIQFIRKGAEVKSIQPTNIKYFVDYLQFSFMTKFYFSETVSKNKFVFAVGYYLESKINEKIIDTYAIQNNKPFEFSVFDVGIKGNLGLKFDKYFLVSIQGQISAPDILTKPRLGGNLVYFGLDVSVPVYSF